MLHNIVNYATSSFVVRPGGLEPPRRKTLDPKSSAATNYATGAFTDAKLTNFPFRSKFFGAFIFLVFHSTLTMVRRGSIGEESVRAYPISARIVLLYAQDPYANCADICGHIAIEARKPETTP